jgi:SsrA-binding protein
VAAAKSAKGAKGGQGRQDPNNRTIARNRRARHDYDILETVEAGLSLLGSEVKSLREGHVQLADTYARPERGELWLLGLHIAPYSHAAGGAAGFGGHQAERPRKLLLHRREIDELANRVAIERVQLVPLSLYFKDGRAKLELGVARSRKLHDKRHAIAERDAAREADRAMARARRGETGG